MLEWPTDLCGIDQFTYLPEKNCYICPEGKVLKYTGINKRNNTHVYFSTPKRCRECSQKSRCTRGEYRTPAIHTCEAARQRAHALANPRRVLISASWRGSGWIRKIHMSCPRRGPPCAGGFVGSAGPRAGHRTADRPAGTPAIPSVP